MHCNCKCDVTVNAMCLFEENVFKCFSERETKNCFCLNDAYSK